MPHCRKCYAPIIFVPTINNWNNAISEKSLPVDINPDPTNGTLSLFQWPVLFKGTKPDNPAVSMMVARRQGGEALAFLRRRGVALYRVHFDTCTGYKNQNG